MKIDYVGRHLQLNDELRTYTESKLTGAIRFLEEPVEIRVILEEEGHRRIAELRVHHRFGVLQAVEESDELRDAIHDAVDKIEKQARRGRKKFMDQRRRRDRQVAQEWPVDDDESSTADGDEKPRIIKSRTLSIKPMSLDEAALRLETARNDFIVFRDAEHGAVAVLYKRLDGDYGLIDAEAY